MHPPLVNILVTTYNSEEFIAHTLSTLIVQNYPNFKIIIVDDGSTDETPKRICEWAAKYQKVYTFFPGRLGRAKALNYGLAQCQGKYVAINDADDHSIPERIQKQVDFLEAHPEIGLLGTWKAIRENGQTIEDQKPVKDRDMRKYFTKGQPIQHSSVMFRRELLEKVGGYNEQIPFLLDRDIFLRVARHCKMAQLPEPLIILNRSEHQYFKHKYVGIPRLWLSTKYQLQAVRQFGFPWWWKIEIIGKFLYGLILNILRKNNQ